jgi:molecular chaperone GrpE
MSREAPASVPEDDELDAAAGTPVDGAPPTGGASGQEPAGEEPAGEETAGEEPAGGEPDPPADIDVEDLIESLETVTRQRDEYLDALQRLQAEFDNYRKRTMAAVEDRVAAGLGRLAESLLPVLDACDAAVQAGEEAIGPVGKQLLDVLAKDGLERIETVGRPFDPAVHEAVLHDGGNSGEPMVTQELRAGYVWRGKVLRAAMVKVSG